MTAPAPAKIAIGLVIILAGGGAVILFSNLSPSHKAGPPVESVVNPGPPPPIVHSAAWYVAHPDVLKTDEQRCAGDAATMTQAACQNAASADAQLAGADYAKAAATLNAESASGKTPNQKSP